MASDPETSGETSEPFLNGSIKTVTDKPKFIRTINLYTAIALSVGKVVGAGIFISPKGVLFYTGSAGLSLIVWAICGLTSMGTALCLAELATMLKESGGAWAYIRRGIGGPPAFVAAFLMFILTSGGGALITVVSAEYLLAPFIDDCSNTKYLTKILAMCLLLLIGYVNTSTPLVHKVMRVTFIIKLVTMLIIAIGGIYWMSINGTEKLFKPFEGTTNKGWNVFVSFYSGLFAYQGSGAIVNVCEEIKNYKRNIPLSIIISLTIVTVLYLLINVSYYAVLGPQLVMASGVVVLEWGQKVFGQFGIVFSFLVSISAVGAATSAMFGLTRQMCCLAREGHTIQLLAMVDVEQSIPVVALFVQITLAIIFVQLGDSIITLMNFISFLGTFIGIMVPIALVRLKLQKYNEDQDRFRVPLALPILMILVDICLALVPIINDPSWYQLYGILISLSMLILYFPFVRFKSRVLCFDKVTTFIQKLLGVAVIDKCT